MPKPVEKPSAVLSYALAQQQNNNTDGNTKPLKKPGAHLGKDEVSREVVKRIMDRVKRI